MSNKRPFGWFIRVAIALMVGLGMAAVSAGAASAAPTSAGVESEPEVHISPDGKLTVTKRISNGTGRGGDRVQTICEVALTPPIADGTGNMKAFYSVSCDTTVQSIILVVGIFVSGGAIVGGADVPLTGPAGVSGEITRPCVNGNLFSQFFVQIRFNSGFPPIISGTLTSPVVQVTC